MVGKLVLGVEVKIVDDGEILLCLDSVFDGYFNKFEVIVEVLEGGWLYIGDVGYLEDDGYFVVFGCVFEVMYMVGGECYVFNYIENWLKFSFYIKDVVVIGVGLDELMVMVCVDFEVVGYWVEVNGVFYVFYVDLF